MYQSSIRVFKEITTPVITLFVHYKIADEDSEDYIVVDKLLTSQEHYELLEAD